MSKERSWKELAIGGVCSKSSVGFLTGDWKTYMPVRDPEKCTKCLTCVMFCPEGAIKWKPEKGDIGSTLASAKAAESAPTNAPPKQ